MVITTNLGNLKWKTEGREKMIDKDNNKLGWYTKCYENYYI